MLRTRFHLPVFAGRFSTFLLASIVAALLGSAVFAALPTASGGPDTRPAVELTSGGKFAARIPGQEQDRSTEASGAALSSGTAGALGAALAFAMLPMTGSDSVAAVPPGDAASDKPSRSRGRPARLALSRHMTEVTPLPLARPTTLPPVEASAAAADGMMPKLMSTARSLWSFSTSTGAALVSRFVP